MSEPNQTEPPPELISLNEIAELLVRHMGKHEGLWELTFEVQVAIGKVGPNPDSVLPGAAMGVSKIGLMRTDSLGPFTIDAARVNPPR